MTESAPETGQDACTVVVLQHGEKERRAGDPGLTATGLVQAATAAAALAPLRPTVLISSPLLRARQTIAPLAERLGLGVATDERLRERMNLEPDHDPERFFSDWTRTVQDRAYVPAYGRSSAATGQDMLSVLDEVASPGRVVVLAGHGGATVDLLRTLLGDDDLETRRPGLVTDGVPGGALTTLARTTAGWTVGDIASIAHLSADEVTGHRR